MSNYDVIVETIGPIEPTGVKEEDDIRYKNLEALTEVVRLLLNYIDKVLLRYIIAPTGVREGDDIRYKNLEELTEVVNLLLSDINNIVTTYGGAGQSQYLKFVEHSKKFFNSIRRNN